MTIRYVCSHSISRSCAVASIGSLSSASILRSLLRIRPNLTHIPRSYSKDASGKRPRSDQRAQVGTVTTANGLQTPLSDLLRKIKPLERVHAGDSSLLIFLTPSYARHARDANLPLELLRQLYGEAAGEISISSTTAVVDALSAPNHEQTITEGIAFALQSGVGHWSQQEPLRTAAQRAGAFSFDLEGTSEQRWGLQMPLSQTIFSTGLTSTLISRSYQGHTLVTDEEQLENVTFSMQWEPASDAPEIDYPLVQLTTYRTIQNSMGNIIRTLSSHDGKSSKEEPASRGLEEAVSAYFKALNIPPEPVDVWALIIPRSIVASGLIKDATEALVLDDTALQKLWSSSQADNETFRTLVKHRSRLVKVLSGGGGWGKKAGLLSLDPDLEYSTRELRDDHGWKFDFDMGEDDTPSSIERQLDQALGSSVEEGDGVVFFIAPKHVSQQKTHAVPQRATLSFGMCAPADAHGEGLDNAVQHEKIAYHANFFGISSETGMALQIRDNNGILLSRTKLEVPGLRMLMNARQ